MREYLYSLYDAIPSYIYEILLSVFCLGAIVFLLWAKKNSILYITRLLLFEYLSLIFCSTFVYRETKEVRTHRLDPFWSYKVPSLMPENVMNVAVFVVFGILIAASFKRISWWKNVLIGFILSLIIELLQYTFKRGSFDVDDLINNTSGTVLGTIMCLTVTTLWKIGKVKCK